MPALKYSRQREAIKNFLMTRKDHPTADVVYSSVRHEFPNISLGTVYRNLTLLADIGEIARLRLGDGIDHFDADTSPHYHFICKECGRVVDLKLEALQEVDKVNNTYLDGNRVTGHITYFFGSCDECCHKQLQETS